MQFEEAGQFILDKLKDELPAHLTYHHIDHVRDVYNSAKLLGEAENIPDDDMKLLLTAAWYHDSGFLACYKGHEKESCRIARATLPDYGYSESQIDKICVLIMATRLPQSPKNLLEKILADADLDYLGRDDFFTIAHKLYLEYSCLGFIIDENEWDHHQVNFIKNHHYFTKSDNNLRQAKKEANLEKIKARLNTGIK
jgi:uncharacterized protein